MDRIIDITYELDQSISKDDMRSEWIRIINIVKQYKRDKYKFVKECHKLFRIKHQIGYQTYSWNVFDSLLNKSNCSCLCSTLFIALCCYEVGLFPNELVIGCTMNHMFIITADYKYCFETTETCGIDNWYTSVKYYI